MADEGGHLGALRLWHGLFLLLAVFTSPAHAQFLPRDALIPFELAARQTAPDRAGPTPDQLGRMNSIEHQVRIEQSCTMAWDPALEAPRRELLELYEQTYGPGHPATARPLLSLLCNYAYNAKTPERRAERDALINRLISLGRLRAQPAFLFAGLNARTDVLLDQQKPEPAIADATEALALARTLFGSRPDIIASIDAQLASALEAAGRIAQAEPLRQEAVTLQQSVPGSDQFTLASAFEALGDNLIRQMREADARTCYARELEIFEAALPRTDSSHLDLIVAYSQRLFWTDPARVEALYRAILTRQEADPASSDARNWMTLWNLAKSARLRADLSTAISYQRRVIAAVGPGPDHALELDLARMLAQSSATASEAEAIYRRALAGDPDNPQLLEEFGNTLWTLGRFDEALPAREHAVEVAIRRFGPNHRETLRLTQNLGVALWIKHNPAEARPYYEAVLSGYRAELSAIPETANAEYRRNLNGFVSSKASELLRLYWSDRMNAGTGGEAASRNKGFLVSQLTHPSVSSAAISETAARALAARAGKATIFTGWTAARDRVVALDQAITDAAGQGIQGDAQRVRLLGERAAAGSALTEATDLLRRELPGIFATLRPDPVSIAELRGDDGQQALLRSNEGLILLYPGMPDARGEMSRGIVFAITNEGVSWSEIPLDGAELAQMVEDLHRQLSDPNYSGLTLQAAGESSDGYLGYDRRLAFRLYQALLGNPDVARLLKNKDRWLLVPEGPLLRLNFAALVSAQPQGGGRGDIDPQVLRTTRWLGLERILTVLPSVNALRTARRNSAAAAVKGSFFGLGDPAFRGVADGPGKELPGRLRGAPDLRTANAILLFGARKGLYRDGVAAPEMISRLPRLEYSAAEVKRMGAELGAGPDQQLFQLDATQANIERRNRDGSLGKSSVILFATHALIGGGPDDSQAEPALALTPGPHAAGTALDPANDGLLTASEVAQLRLNAALVILSACNTAAGSGDGEGFSGLTRAFLLAGARAVLASYSPVVDEVAGRLTTTTVAEMRDTHGDIAAALREAMRQVAADPALDARGESLAHPSAWAVYVAVDPS